jgi:NodT family efflux transporter outer membrane factor (OMF) lipoprotein
MVGPDYIKPTAPEPQEWLESADSKIESKTADFSAWWTVFNDPILNALVQSAYQQNLSLQVTGIRILEARAQLGIAIGNQYPQTQRGRADARVDRTSLNLPNVSTFERFSYLYDVGFDAAWELDFWGKFRRSVQTGVADLQASIADYDDNLVFLTSEVARVYIQLRTSEERLVVARENAEIQRHSLRLAEERFKEGAVTKLDALQSRALLRTTEATIPKFESDIRRAKNALAILLGKLPGEIDAKLGGSGRIPQMPAEAAVGIPAELLRRRPDIRLAERRLAAQSAQIGVAKADLFPHFSLFGTIGYSTAGSTSRPQSRNAGLSELFKGRSFTYSAGPSVKWDLFNYGRITNSIRAQDARFQQLAVDYENTVLKAVQEVEDAMIGFLRTQDQVAFLADAVVAYKESVELSSLQYMEGEADFQRVLDALENLVEQQDSWITATGEVGVNLIFIYKALGGGWEMRAGKDFVPSYIKTEMKERTNWGDLLSPNELEFPPSQEVNRRFNRPDW